jgi:transposase-like protein
MERDKLTGRYNFGNTQELRCPACESKNLVYEGQEDRWVCDDCGYEE